MANDTHPAAADHPAHRTPAEACKCGAPHLHARRVWMPLLGLLVAALGALRADVPGDDARLWPVAEVGASYTALDNAAAPQWHLERVSAPQAWEASRGEGVLIAVIDSGVDAHHPDLRGRVVAGWNLVEDSADTHDTRGHGTAVAGAAAGGFNQARGAGGVATHARILPMKVTDEKGYTSVNAVVKAIHMAADRGARVVNVSFEFVGGHPAVLRAARYLQDRGGVLVVPSGNRGVRQEFPVSTGIVTVAATTAQDDHPRWSTHGPHVTVSAPGQALLLPQRGGRYSEVSGTSYASPLVAGVLALMMAAQPQATPAELVAVLQATAQDLGEPGADPLFGAGRVDAGAALSAMSAVKGASRN